MANDSQQNDVDPVTAFLVVREGSSWRNVYRLAPGQVTTVGRSSTNRIVVRNEVCSRNHCEVFSSGNNWILRDLDSRNGTYVDGKRVAGDWGLEPGQMIQIGSCELGFTNDLAKPFPKPKVSQVRYGDNDTATIDVFDHPESDSEPAIIHRQRINPLKKSDQELDVVNDSVETVREHGRELTSLYQLALQMGACRDSKALAEVVLEALLENTEANSGGILLLASGGQTEPEALDLICCTTPDELPYQRISDYLSSVVLKQQEAILARDVADDSRLATRDSLGEIHAQSVICSPIRSEEELLGLIHLYTTDPDYPVRPDDLEFTLAVADQLAVALENLKQMESLAVGLERVQKERDTLRQELGIQSELIGQSESMLELKDSIRKIAPTDATVLIRGESGVGKELVARAIHYNSSRRNGPFVCMNCAALTESLLESELFGHEKGSFTGATDRKMGKFEQADQGTLFLDEVGEMSLGVQAKFLRVLEGHAFERVGGRTPVQVDVRVVAATNRDLEHAVEEGRLRRDLYFRLHVVEIRVIPLRERQEDIPQLAHYFLQRYSEKTGRGVKGFTKGALEVLMQHEWTGNVRELQNTIERSLILCSGDYIRTKDINMSTLGNRSDSDDESTTRSSAYRQLSLELLEQEHILSTLRWTNWNKSKAASILGIERSTLDRKLKRYQVNKPNP